MTTSVSIIKTDDQSKAGLAAIFDPVNEISCSAYGGGGHCNPTRTAVKINLWGKRGDAATSENLCALAKIVYVDSEPAAMFNIGFSGNTPTVLDKSAGNAHLMYEFSGIFIADKFLGNAEIANTVRTSIADCKVDTNYSKVFASFSSTHPYQKDFFLQSGAKEVTAENIEVVLGAESLHPGRFKIEDSKVYECVKWDKGSPKIQHTNGWSDSDQCTDWVEKLIFVFDINDQAIEISSAGVALDHSLAK